MRVCRAQRKSVILSFVQHIAIDMEVAECAFISCRCKGLTEVNNDDQNVFDGDTWNSDINDVHFPHTKSSIKNFDVIIA